MGSRIALVFVLALVLLAPIAGVGCGSGGTGGTSEPISPTWIGSEVLEIEGNSLLLPTSEVASGRMLHFAITFGEGNKQNFMAYKLDGESHVRANVCPPCRSVGFSLAGDILVCTSCGTRFKASTGGGISGACKDYPKAEVVHTIRGDKITMELDDLLTAYQNTEKPGWP